MVHPTTKTLEKIEALLQKGDLLSAGAIAEQGGLSWASTVGALNYLSSRGVIEKIQTSNGDFYRKKGGEKMVEDAKLVHALGVLDRLEGLLARLAEEKPK